MLVVMALSFVWNVLVHSVRLKVRNSNRWLDCEDGKLGHLL